MCKSFEKCKGECESIRGVILAPVCSLINHSCNSNVNRIFLPNGKVVMFTVAPVKEGEQVGIFYLKLTMSLSYLEFL